MKRIRMISFILSIVLLTTTMAGCGAGEAVGPEVGKWHGEFSINDLSGSLAQEDKLLLAMIAGDVFYEIDLEFYKDGTFTYKINADKLKEAISGSVSAFMGLFVSFDVSLFTDRLVAAAMEDVMSGTKQFYSGKYTKSDSGIITATDDTDIFFKMENNVLIQIDSAGNEVFKFYRAS